MKNLRDLFINLRSPSSREMSQRNRAYLEKMVGLFDKRHKNTNTIEAYMKVGPCFHYHPGGELA